MSFPPKLLLVHPPIYDFTAFDLFLYPLGLLEIATVFESAGWQVRLVDALDRFAAPTSSGQEEPQHQARLRGRSAVRKPTFRPDGCGHFRRQRIPSPPLLDHVPRHFHRFGMPRDELARLMARDGPPDLVGIGCTMTYWYLGIQEVVGMARELFGSVPIALGGVYASLCADHARGMMGVDCVLTGRDLSPLLEIASDVRRDAPPAEAFRLLSLTRTGVTTPAHHLLGARDSAAVRATCGCPYRCTYCAAHQLAGSFRARSRSEVIDELVNLVDRHDRRQIAFHDDSLISRSGKPFLELVEEIRAVGLHRRARFYSINGVNAAAIDDEVAEGLAGAGFVSVRIGFETSDHELQATTGGKTSGADLDRALTALRRAGFGTREVGVYVMVGLPDQDEDTIWRSLDFVHRLGARIHLTEYAPVPGTPTFERAKALSRLDLGEPLHHNKTLAGLRFETLTLDQLRRIKDRVRTLNQRLSG